MERYNCTCHCGGSMFYKHLHDPSCDLFMHGEEAPQSEEAQLQAALDAERERVKELEEWQRVVVGTGTDQEAVVRMAATEYTKTAVQCWKDENAKLTAQLATLQAQLRQVEGERDQWIAANTKEPINEPVTYQALAGARFVAKRAFDELVKARSELSALRQLVEALPVVDGRMDVECGACYYIRSFVAGQYGIVCGLMTEQSTAMAIKTLLEYRATLAARDAGRHHEVD